MTVSQATPPMKPLAPTGGGPTGGSVLPGGGAAAVPANLNLVSHKLGGDTVTLGGGVGGAGKALNQPVNEKPAEKGADPEVKEKFDTLAKKVDINDKAFKEHGQKITDAEAKQATREQIDTAKADLKTLEKDVLNSKNLGEKEKAELLGKIQKQQNEMDELEKRLDQVAKLEKPKDSDNDKDDGKNDSGDDGGEGGDRGEVQGGHQGGCNVPGCGQGQGAGGTNGSQDGDPGSSGAGGTQGAQGSGQGGQGTPLERFNKAAEELEQKLESGTNEELIQGLTKLREAHEKLGNDERKQVEEKYNGLVSSALTKLVGGGKPDDKKPGSDEKPDGGKPSEKKPVKPTTDIEV